MMKTWRIVLLGLSTGLAVAARGDVTPETATPAKDASAQEELVLDLTCLLATNGPGVVHGRVVARIHEYDLRKPDSAAREVCRVELSGVSHRPGAETVLRFPCAAPVPERKAYYLTVVVYTGAAPADSAGMYYLTGFRRVFTGGNRESLSVTLTPVGGEGEPSN